MKWKRIEPTKVTKVGWRKITTKTFVQPDGTKATYDTYDKETATYVGVIALTDANKVIVAKQFRPGPEKLLWEIPGGGVESGDEGDLRAAATRELAEETGYSPGLIEYVGHIYKDAMSNGTWHYFFATGCKLNGIGQALDDGEFVQTELLSVADFLDKAKAGLMTDTEAVFLAYEQLLQCKGDN